MCTTWHAVCVLVACDAEPWYNEEQMSVSATPCQYLPPHVSICNLMAGGGRQPEWRFTDQQVEQLKVAVLSSDAGEHMPVVCHGLASYVTES